MPFAIEDFHDLGRLLEEHPEWRSELRRLALTDQLLALPEQLAELRASTEPRFEALATAQQRTETQVATVATQLADLIQVVQTFATDLGTLKGRSLEWEYRTKVYAYCRRIVRRTHILAPDELTDWLEDASERRILSEAQAEDIARADVIVRGRRRSDGAEVLLVVEVAWGVGVEDVARALRRASLVAHSGTPAIPVVAGTWVTSEATDLAYTENVWQVTNGQTVPPR